MKQTAAVLIAAMWLPAAAAKDWPRWRGPQLNGISQEKGWLDQWPKDGPPVVWKTAVGVGFSSVAVAQGRLYTMGHKEGKDTVFCLDAVTGKPVWSHSYDSDLGDLNFEGGPAATPTVHDGAVYTLSHWGDLFCFDAAKGQVRWSRNLAKEDNARAPTWGFSGSPLVHEKLLLLNVGKAGMALQKDTGKLVWSSGDEEAGYSTPIPFQRGKEWFAIVSSGAGFTAVNVATGKELWEYRWLTRYGVNSADPILAGDQVFISSGYNKGCALLKMGDGEPKEIWRNKNMRNQFNSSVLLDGFLYGIDGDTTTATALRCVDFKTGEVRWSKDGYGSGSVTAADGKLIVLSDEGELLVGPASSKGFTPSARARVLDGKCWTVPVLANGRIYCRNAAGDLVCLDVREKK
jgi:outer membrane protein assembly factor BamB